MRNLKNNRWGALISALPIVIAAAGTLAVGQALAAVPGITGSISGTATTFNLSASANSITQPDGNAIYSWGYGCTGTYTGGYLPITTPAFPHSCGAMTEILVN